VLAASNLLAELARGRPGEVVHLTAATMHLLSSALLALAADMRVAEATVDGDGTVTGRVAGVSSWSAVHDLARHLLTAGAS
jgi:hypothetical protein